MNQLARLTDQASGTLEAELVRHARAEQPPPLALPRLAAALGIGAAASIGGPKHLPPPELPTANSLPPTSGTGMTGSEPLTQVTKFGLSNITRRWLLPSGMSAVIAIGALVGTKGLWIASRTNSGTSAQRRPIAGAPSANRVILASPIASTSVAPRVDAKSSGLASLAPEISILDAARALLESGKPSLALELLDAYDERFPAGTLAPEARVIRVQALLQSGKRSTAVRLGTEFLSLAPASPHAHRIRQLLGPKADVVKQGQ